MSHSQSPPETWHPVRRAAAALASPIQRILAIEAASGLLLLAATVVALVWANTSPHSYDELWQLPIGGRLGGWSFERPLHFWINDGLMTVFFFVVGLEIRREIFEGELATIKQAALPLAAALGGMLVPAAIFVITNHGRSGEPGWAIPMATDIAFAVGAVTVLGARVATPLRVLLLALAVIDDIGAIVVIAVFYSAGVSGSGVALAGGGIAVVWVMRAAGVRAPVLYVPAALIVWVGVLATGIHPTIAGVMLGMMTPVRAWFGPSRFAETTQAHLDKLPSAERSDLMTTLAEINRARKEAVSPAERLIHSFHPWVAFVIMPVFALANAGVPLGGATFSGDAAWLMIGVIGGLVVGKPLGIATGALVAARLGIATRSPHMTARGIVVVGMVGGIGFTMSLFIAQLAFPPGGVLDTAKLAILIGSSLSVVVGLVSGRAMLSAQSH